MRKLLMVLFLFGTISVFCNAQIEAQLQISVTYFCSIGLYFLV